MDFASLDPPFRWGSHLASGLRNTWSEISRLLNGRDKHILDFLVEQRKGLNENAGN